MKFENIRVMNFENAIRGMRHPKLSYHLSDSEFGLGHEESCDRDYAVAERWFKYLNEDEELVYNEEQTNQIDELDEWLIDNGILYKDGDIFDYAFIGPQDLDLMQKLIKGGSEHRKFMRQIFVSVDITAPLYW